MIPLPSLSGQTIGVLGLGASGLATAAALTSAGAVVQCWDDDEACRRAAVDSGYDVAEPVIPGIAMLVSSPGIPIAYPAPHPLIGAALEKRIPIVGDVELFAQARPILPAHTVVGVTGTNGKSTTTALIAHCLVTAGRAVQIGGNFGPPVLSMAPSEGVYVLELSSFQLEQTQSLACDVAVFLNLTPDHSDRYASMADYGAAKQRLFDMQRPDQRAMIAIDDAEGRRLAGQVSAQVDTVSSNDQDSANWKVVSGNLVHNGALIAAQADWPALKGPHNAQNAAVAAAACHALGLSRAEIAAGLASFESLEHRSQCVAEAGHITFINDSKATNPDAAARSLQAYTNIYWIAGGSNKGSDFTPLRGALGAVTSAFFYGETGPSLAAALGYEAANVFGTLESAFTAALSAAQRAKEPATVLLSPACASFDQFSSFAHRGEVFTQLARCAQKKAA